jgi:imidazolonepropionase-like amidohydrolase
LDWALEAGLDSLEHAYHITDIQIEKLGKSATWPVLTPSPLVLKKRIEHLPESLIPGHKNERDQIISRMMALISSGIPYAVGSDGMHGALADEISYLIDMGASHIAALKAATIHGAIVAGIDDQTGSLEAGKKADIIAVSGNPLKNIKTLKNVIAVMKEGEWIIKPKG